MENGKCPLCSCDSTFVDLDGFNVNCPNCGPYLIKYGPNGPMDKIYFATDDHIQENRSILSGYIYEHFTELGLHCILSIEKLKRIIDSNDYPKTIQEKLDKLLSRFAKQTKALGDEIHVDLANFAFGYASSPNEFQHMLEYLKNKSYIDARVAYRFFITPEGLDAAIIYNGANDSNQCFVAMWFGEQMEGVFAEAIKPAIESNGKYVAIKIDDVIHFDDITDRIIGEIRKSKFIVADFTGDRGGVYYEAGFAHGLGKKVIFTCRDDWFKTTITKELTGIEKGTTDEKTIMIPEDRKVHFDIDHRKFIVWKDKDDLKKQLTDVINANII